MCALAWMVAGAAVLVAVLSLALSAYLWSLLWSVDSWYDRPVRGSRKPEDEP